MIARSPRPASLAGRPNEALAHGERFVAGSLLLTVFLVPLVLRGDTPYALDVKWPVLGVGVVLCAAGLLLWWALGGRFGRATVPVIVALVVYLGSAVLSTVRSEYAPISYAELWWTGARAVLFLAAVVAGRRWPGAFVVTIVLAVALVAGAGWLQRFGHDPYGFSWNKGEGAIDLRHARILSTIGLETALGGYLAVGAVFTLGAGVLVATNRRRSLEERIVQGAFCGAIAATAVGAMVISGTRGAWFAFLLGLLLLDWALRAPLAPAVAWIKSNIAVVGPPVLVIALILVAHVGPPIFQRLATLPNHLAVRTTIWNAALRMTYARPVTGHGPGTFRRQFPLHRPSDYANHPVGSATVHAHCEYLDIAAETGLLGLATFAIFVGLIATGSVTRLQVPSLRRRALLGVGLAAAVTMLAHASIQVDTRYPTCLMMLWVLLGFTVSQWERPWRGTPRRLAPKLILGGACVLLVAVTWTEFVLLPYTARKALRRATVAFDRSDWRTAVQEAQKARQLDRTLCEAYHEEARALLRIGAPGEALSALMACHAGPGPHYYDTDLHIGVANILLGRTLAGHHWLAIARRHSVAYGDFWNASSLDRDQLFALADHFAKHGIAYVPKLPETSRPATSRPGSTTPQAGATPPGFGTTRP
jgi:hypothetical protein